MEVNKQRMSIVNRCAISEWSRRSVQYMVLLLKYDILADSIYIMSCMMAWPAVQWLQSFIEYQRIMWHCKRKVWTVSDMVHNFRHWPWASRDSGGRSSAIIAPWQTIGQTLMNVWRGKPLETRSPRTKRLMSQHRCVRSCGGNGREMPPSILPLLY